ncbi:MAG TPA: hypothetical protein VLZ44_05460 [Treponemataceae bacterium]|nr:hypothetical protein [Treponemataceae bacterium]
MENRETKRDIEKDTQRLLEEKRLLASKMGKILYEQNHSFAGEKERETILRLLEDKEHLEDLTEELASLQERFLSEIESQKILDAEIKELSKEWSDLLKDFGKLLLENYSPVFADFLGESFAEYETQKAVIKNIEEKIDTERAEIEKMGFFSKILNQVKLSTTSANLTGQERKLQKLYVDVGHLGVQASVFTREEAKDFDQEILDAHTKALQRQESLNEKKVLLANAQNAEQLIAQNIDAIGPKGSFNKKTIALEKQALDMQIDIENQYAIIGEAFIDEKVGNEVKKAIKKTDDMDDVLFVLVKDAAEIQKTIRNNEKKIAYIDLEAEIATKERQKKHMQQNIIQNNESIERLKEQNEGLSNKITVAADEIDRLLRDKANLAKEIS